MALLYAGFALIVAIPTLFVHRRLEAPALAASEELA